VVLYGCEIWSLTLKEEHRLRVLSDEVKGGFRKLRNVELRNLYPLPSIIRIIKSRRKRWAEHKARMGDERKAYTRRLLVGKPQGKRPLGRPSGR
jgi:hypothetical protein